MTIPQQPHCGHKPSSELALNKQICVSLYQTAHRTARLYGRLLAPHGLTFPQFQVLLALMELGQSSVGTLCTTLDLDTSTVTSVLKRLEANGFVMRFRDRIDERRVFAVLTDKGHAFAPDAQAIRRRYIEQTGFTMPDLIALRSTLQKLSASIQLALD